MKMLGAVLCAIAVGTSAVAQQPTVQEQFDGASETLKAGKWAEAAAAFEALEPRLIKNRRSLAVVRVRKAQALYELDRDAEAALALKAGLADLPPNDTSLREDRSLALMLLGDMDFRALDYASALPRYREAERFADTPVTKARAIAAMVQSGTFVDPDVALADIDRALAIVAPMPPDKIVNARFGMMKGRVLLNLGRFKDAQLEFDKAVKALGGLTMRVNQDDVAARSDYAIAAMLAGDDDRARKYLAYTGAGRLPERFESGNEMSAPPCGGPDGLQPDDVGVVEFSIRPDGSVGSARPIYSSRRGKSALEFARAVADWSWAPEKVKDIPALFRTMTRIEMRCSTLAARPSIPSLLLPMLESWAAEKKVEPVRIEAASDARRLPLLLAELGRRETAFGAASLQLLPLLLELANSSMLGAEDALAHAKRALAIADPAQPPASARLLLSHFLWVSQAGNDRSKSSYLRALEGAIRDPAIAQDPVARAAAGLMLVDGRRQKQSLESAILLREISDDTSLASNDPFRVGALIRLASWQFRSGDVDAARASFERSGLSAEQCALADAPPRMRSGSISDGDFPQEALTWGFSGWTDIQFDIGSDGKTLNRRALIAYPPFVFGGVTADYVRRFQYELSYRPGEALACGGSRQRVTYRNWR